jgi:hypothetical protein
LALGLEARPNLYRCDFRANVGRTIIMDLTKPDITLHLDLTSGGKSNIAGPNRNKWQHIATFKKICAAPDFSRQSEFR